MTKKTAVIILFVICVAAGLLRSPMITTGLPYLFHPDEYSICNAGFENVKYGRLDPRVYLYPYYSIFAYTAIDYAVFLPGFTKKDRQDLEPRDFYLADRLLSFSFSIASIILTYILASSLAGRAAGLCAALLSAGSYGMLESSCLIKPDSGMIMFTLLALVFIARIPGKPSFKNILAACFFSLSAFLFKYNTAVVFIPLAIALFGVFKGREKTVLSAAGISLLAVILSLLPVASSFPRVIDTFKSNVSNQVLGGGFHFNTFFIQYFFTKGLGPLSALICFAGLFYITVKKPKENLVLTSALWPALLFLFSVRVNFNQYAWMSLAMLCVAGGIFLSKITKEKLKLMFVLALVAPLSNFMNISALLAEHTTTDTRLLAKYWIEKHIPPGESLIYSMFGPPLSDYDPAVNGNPSLVDPSRDATYCGTALVLDKLIGYKYYAVSSLAGKPNDRIPAGYGRVIAVINSEYDDRPSIIIAENTMLSTYKYKKIFDVNPQDSSKWHPGPLFRDTKPNVGPLGKTGVRLAFSDPVKTNGYHFFIQHTDLNMNFDWEYSAKDMEYLRVVANWPSDTRLDVSYKMQDGNILYVLECKRGFNAPHEFIFPLPAEKTKQIMFALNTAHNSRGTNKIYAADIEIMEVVSVSLPNAVKQGN